MIIKNMAAFAVDFIPLRLTLDLQPFADYRERLGAMNDVKKKAVG